MSEAGRGSGGIMNAALKGWSERGEVVEIGALQSGNHRARDRMNPTHVLDQKLGVMLGIEELQVDILDDWLAPSRDGQALGCVLLAHQRHPADREPPDADIEPVGRGALATTASVRLTQSEALAPSRSAAAETSARVSSDRRTVIVDP